jgi:YrbI family 3-deoxy-D-manno-octulosonate 8-phosphate phosphatase
VNILAIVPARGGSKGLFRKNVRLLAGHPLLAYSVVAAGASECITRVICSTDDAEIAEVARRYGAETPFLRPAHLAQDDTLDLPVMQHAIEWLRQSEGWRTDIVVQLRPTSPIRPVGLVSRAVKLLLADDQATAVRTVCPAPANPHKMWRLSDGNAGSSPYMRNLLDVSGIAEPYNAPRQKLPTIWWQTGTVDVARAAVIEGGSMTGARILPCIVDSEIAVDIDDERALNQAAEVMAHVDCVRLSGELPWPRIKLLVLDVDGTLTPGTMYYGPDGEALKRFHTHDGQGISLVRESGIIPAVITGEATPIAPARALKLGIAHVHIAASPKLPVLRQLAEKLGINMDEICYVGDDLGDVECMEAIRLAGGIACAVADARVEACRAANWITTRAGGHGAVRDVCDRLLAARKPL